MLLRALSRKSTFNSRPYGTSHSVPQACCSEPAEISTRVFSGDNLDAVASHGTFGSELFQHSSQQRCHSGAALCLHELREHRHKFCRHVRRESQLLK